jgi:hypothetical protein
MFDESEETGMVALKRPELVVAADWSKDSKKRWMARAELQEDGAYLVFPPEPVGDINSLRSRLSGVIPKEGRVLLGFDFPIGLPRQFAAKVKLTSFREALKGFRDGDWKAFYNISDSPTLHQPFYPLPKKRGEKGFNQTKLATALGFSQLKLLLRQCDLGTKRRRDAECLFFTLGGRQVGAGAVIGWEYVLQPGLAEIRLWPFDGPLDALLKNPGLVVAEIYPGEAYVHLGIRIGAGTGLTKTSRDDRQSLATTILDIEKHAEIFFCEAAKSWVTWGFLAEDDFDAMVGLLSMLLVVTGKRSDAIPDDEKVRTIEGWILGQPG